MRKLNLEFIQQEYAKRNYVFLDDYYENARHKHNIKCLTCGHKWGKTYDAFKQDKGCPKCSGNIKLTLEFIKQEYSKRNYEFLDDSYKNAGHKHNIKCLACGHEWKQSYHSSQQGQGCPKCARENRSQTNLRRYGCKSPLSNRKIQDRIKQTCLEKYGCENPMQEPEIALKCAKSQKNIYIRHHFITNQELICQASYEVKVIDYLNNNKINYLWQPKVFKLSTGKTYRPDLYLVDLDIWVEIKGLMRPHSLIKWDEFHTEIQTNSELWDKAKLIKLGINLNKKL